MQVITSKTNNKIKFVTYLKTSKGRKENHLFVSEGFKAFEMALKSNLVVDVFSLKPLGNLPLEINQYIVSEDVLNKLACSINPEGIVFVSKIPEYSFSNNYKKIIYLDNIQDPGNMGTLIRTALAFNYDAVIASKESVDFYNEKVIASSKGAIFSMPLFKGDISKYKSGHKIIVSTLNKKAINLEKVKPLDDFILILGNEAHGVKEEILDIADMITIIPIDNIDSLNVAIAGGILMYHFK